MSELPKTYEPSAVQARWLQHWESHGYCNADPNPDREPHTIMIPLPNVTGALHMGHCLNGTLQDLLTRWRRMQGREALWMPGTDHAGIATQAVVERRMLEEEGLTRRRHRPRRARRTHLEVERRIRRTHPESAETNWSQLRLAACSIHAG